MKVTCKTRNLNDAFQLVSGVVETKATKKILQDVKIETVGKDGLQLSATDLEIGIKCLVGAAEVAKEGAVVVPATSMAGILSTSADEAMELKVEGETCEVRGKDSFFKLPTQNPDEYPMIPDFPDKKTIEIAAGDLHSMIRRTVFCVALEQTRYALNGLLLAAKKGRMVIVATDGRRLARIVRKVKGADISQTIVPAKAVSVLDRMLASADEAVQLVVYENKLWARSGANVLCAALVEGQFPDYEAVIPSDCTVKVSLPREELLSAVRRAGLLTDSESQAVRLTFSEDHLTLRYEAPDRGAAKVDMDVKYAKEEFSICFNPGYIEDMLKAVDEDEVQLELKDSETAGVFRAGEDYLYLIMPISLTAPEAV